MAKFSSSPLLLHPKKAHIFKSLFSICPLVSGIGFKYVGTLTYCGLEPWHHLETIIENPDEPQRYQFTTRINPRTTYVQTAFQITLNEIHLCKKI